MNCNPCCGCFTPITTYNPSAADNFPTILQQVEYLKALLKKYPSQQWFITQEKVTEETKSLDKLSILSNGREPQGGDFILGNKENGTTLLFQYTGVITEYVNYNLIYVGVFTNQDLAEEALAKAQDAGTKAQQALDLATTNEQTIGILNGQVAELETKAINIPKEPPSDNSLLVFDAGGNTTHYIYYGKQYAYNAIPQYDEFGYLHSNINNTLSDDYAVLALKDIKKLLSLQEFKTIFGKKITGSGNIDLYHHEISYGAINNGITITVYFEHYSSNNLKADSITDVKTLLGNTFKKGIFGSITNTATGKALVPLYINETNIFYIGEDGSVQNQSLTGNFNDTVTTI